MVQAGPLETVRQPGDGGQTRPQHGVAVQLHRQQTRRRHGQLPGAERAAEGAGRRGDGEAPLRHSAGGVGTGGLRERVQRHLVAQAQAGYRRQGHLLGPGAAGGPWGHRHPEHGPSDALLGAGRGGHPGLGQLLLAGAGRQRPSGGPVASAGGQCGQQRHHRGAVRQ